jgi:hypothetical protein
LPAPLGAVSASHPTVERRSIEPEKLDPRVGGLSVLSPAKVRSDEEVLCAPRRWCSTRKVGRDASDHDLRVRPKGRLCVGVEDRDAAISRCRGRPLVSGLELSVEAVAVVIPWPAPEKKSVQAHAASAENPPRSRLPRRARMSGVRHRSSTRSACRLPNRLTAKPLGCISKSAAVESRHVVFYIHPIGPLIRRRCTLALTVFQAAAVSQRCERWASRRWRRGIRSCESGSIHSRAIRGITRPRYRVFMRRKLIGRAARTDSRRLFANWSPS